MLCRQAPAFQTAPTCHPRRTNKPRLALPPRRLPLLRGSSLGLRRDLLLDLVDGQGDCKPDGVRLGVGLLAYAWGLVEQTPLWRGVVGTPSIRQGRAAVEPTTVAPVAPEPVTLVETIEFGVLWPVPVTRCVVPEAVTATPPPLLDTETPVQPESTLAVEGSGRCTALAIWTPPANKLVDLTKRTLKQLHEVARLRGLSGYSRLKKAELVAMLTSQTPDRSATPARAEVPAMLAG